jgi:hypothetical protein
MAAFVLDQRDDGVGATGGFLQGRAMGHDAQDAAAGGDDPSVGQAFGAAMDDIDAFRQASRQSDGVALADLARITAGGQDDDDRGAGAELDGRRTTSRATSPILSAGPIVSTRNAVIPWLKPSLRWWSFCGRTSRDDQPAYAFLRQ